MVRFWPNLAQQADGLEGPLLIGFQTIASHNSKAVVDPYLPLAVQSDLH